MADSALHTSHSKPDAPNASPPLLQSFARSHWRVPAILFLLTVIVLAPGLFGGAGTILSSPNCDGAQQFVYYRRWGFDQLRHGHLALWTPYIFSGCPFLGNWQSALLYPPNVIYLFLPLDRAMNCEIAIHVFLAGLGAALWTQRAGVGRAASLLAGCMVMFGAPFFMHAYAGHFSMVDAMAWTPWILLSVDSLLERVELQWVALGAGALGLQILAGHPQTVFITLTLLVVYVALRLIGAQHRAKTILACAALGIGALLLAAGQLVAGMQAAAEGVRHGGVSYGFASMLSLPPENFLTLLAPSFFGNMSSVPYWGRSYLWEADLFVGATGLALAAFGALQGRNSLRWVWIVTALVCLWIALAAHTPLFHLLYSYVPGFNRFRAHAKFVYPASLFIAMLAAQGLDGLLRAPQRVSRQYIAIPVVLALIAGVFGALVLFSNGTITRIAGLMASSGESAMPQEFYANSLAQAQSLAGQQCFYCASVLAMLAVLLLLLPKYPKAGYAMLSLALLEITLYAASMVTTFDLAKTQMPPAERAFLDAHPGDYRILQQAVPPDDVIGSNTTDIWGYDPTVLSRYAEFMAFTQGQDPGQTSSYLTLSKPNPLLRIVRLRYAFVPEPGGHTGGREFANPLPHVFLARSMIVAHGRDPVLAQLAAPGFDPAATAVLEELPPSMPELGEGSAQVSASAPGALTIQADTNRPSLLVIADPYSRFWRATPLVGSAQRSYSVLPCDWAIMAIPLSAGHHVFELRYEPTGFTAALWVSAVAWMSLIGLAGVLLIRRMKGLPAALAV